jgi:ribonuclease J
LDKIQKGAEQSKAPPKTGVPQNKEGNPAVMTRLINRPSVRKRTKGDSDTQAKPEEQRGVLRIIPLGGLGEIGKNMTLFEYGDDIIAVDCGVIFPEGEMLGIDYVIPDAQYLSTNKHKLRGFVFTHGHEDHIGATPFILPNFKFAPIYGGKLTIALIDHKLDEQGVMGIHSEVVHSGSVVRLGCFTVEFLKVNHSIADAFALVIRTPIGTIVHTGDFKVDHTPLDGVAMDLASFAQLGREGVLLLMSDSTNAERPGYTISEQTVTRALDECFGHAAGRILVATFSSNVSRVQQIINIAENHGRRVYLAGRSLERICEIAVNIGYLSFKKGTLLDNRMLDYVEPNEVVIITTGSQGEPMSGLVRMSNDEHRQISIRSDDMVIFSSSPIPGNEKAISTIIDKLSQKGCKVIYDGIRAVHVSGHACQEEQRLMIALTKPKFFIPIHGEYRHLRQHAQTASEQGIAEENIVMPLIGNIVELRKDTIRLGGTVPSGSVFVDGSGIGDVGNVVLRDRRLLSEEGLFIAVVAVDKFSGALISGPEIISRGFVYVRENEQLIDKTRELIKSTIADCQSKYASCDWGTIKSALRSTLRNYLYEQTKRSPMILPVILEIERNEGDAV